MKKSFIGITLLTFLIVTSFTSCRSTKIKELREPDEFFLADIDDFELETINCLSAFGKNDAKATEVYLYASPRTNIIYCYFKLGMDKVAIKFPYAQRVQIKESFNKYLEIIQDTKLANRKTTKKNSFYIGNVDIAWGMGGLTHEVNTEFSANYQFLEKNKPYFKLQFYSTQIQGQEHVGSPYTSIYLSPTQIRKIIEVCNQEKIQAEVDRILKEAYTFDSVEYSFESEETENVQTFVFGDEDESNDDSVEFIDAK